MKALCLVVIDKKIFENLFSDPYATDWNHFKNFVNYPIKFVKL